jgi:hypothetical protein
MRSGLTSKHLVFSALLMCACGGRAEYHEQRHRPVQDAAPGTDSGGANSAPDAGNADDRDAGRDAGPDAEAALDGATRDGDASGTDPNHTPSGFPRCGRLEPERANECEGIDKIALLDPDVSAMVDGSIQVGELGSVSVWVRNSDAVLHFDVCVGVRVDTPGIDVFTEDGETNPTVIGQINAGGTPIVSPAYFQVGRVAAGTVARFTLWSSFRGTNCIGPTASVTAPVRASPF